MCSHLFFPASCSYSAVILEALQNNIRCSPRLSLTRFNILYNLKNFKFNFYCFEFRKNNSWLQQFVFSNSLQLVSAWDCAGLMGCLVRCVSQSKLVSVCLFICYSVLFPSAASQIVSASQRLYVPQREPKYPGNQASFSL